MACILAGVDDAGRGPVIGPMIVAGVAMDEGSIGILSQLGVRDSKTLSPRRREELFQPIHDLTRVEYRVAEPREIDSYVTRRRRFEGLNLLEAKMMAEVIESLRPDVAYVDSCDVSPRRFGSTITRFLGHPVRVVAEHHADVFHPLVSAASIVAKVHRDRAVELLKGNLGDFGSGYAGDPKTRAFLANWYRTRGSFPENVRASWKTLKRVKDHVAQVKLT